MSWNCIVWLWADVEKVGLKAFKTWYNIHLFTICRKYIKTDSIENIFNIKKRLFAWIKLMLYGKEETIVKIKRIKMKYWYWTLTLTKLIMNRKKITNSQVSCLVIIDMFFITATAYSHSTTNSKTYTRQTIKRQNIDSQITSTT